MHCLCIDFHINFYSNEVRTNCSENQCCKDIFLSCNFFFRTHSSVYCGDNIGLIAEKEEPLVVNQIIKVPRLFLSNSVSRTKRCESSFLVWKWNDTVALLPNFDWKATKTLIWCLIDEFFLKKIVCVSATSSNKIHTQILSSLICHKK